MGHDRRVGQSPDEVTEVGRTAPAAPHRADNSTGRHRKLRANCFESHTRFDTTGIHPDQPIPDQPEPDSQIASVPPLFARPVVKYARNASFQRFNVRPSLAISGIGHDENDATTFSAIPSPAARLSGSSQLRV